MPPQSPRRPLRWRTFLIISGIGCVFGWLLPPVDFGNPIPTGPPIEANRVHSPRGFSIINPPGWTVRTEGESPWGMIQMIPPYKTPRRSVMGLFVKILLPNDLPTDHHWQPTTFQGQPARERHEVSENLKHHWTADHFYRFERAGRHYLIRYARPGQDPELPPIVAACIATFQVDPTSPRLEANRSQTGPVRIPD